MALSANAIITLADLKSHLSISVSTFDTQLEDAIDAATDIVEQYLGHIVISRRLREWTDADGRSTLALRERPVQIVHAIRFGRLACMTIQSTIGTDIQTTVSVDSNHIRLDRIDSSGSDHQTTLAFGANKTSSDLASAISATTGFTATATVNVSAYHIHRVAGRDLKLATMTLYAADQGQLDTEVDYGRGLIYMKDRPYGWVDDGWPRGPLSLLVDYTAGYDQADVPFAIQNATRTIAAGLYFARKRDPGLSSESLGDYSYSLASLGDEGQQAMRQVQPFRRIR